MTKEEFEKLQGMVTDEWKGYNLDELKYRRAIALARTEIQKEKMLGQVHHIIDSGLSIHNVGGSLVKNVFGGISIADYVILGYRTVKNITKFIKHWRR